MLMQPDCIVCIMRMALGAIRKLGLTEDQVRQLYRQIIILDVFRKTHGNELARKPSR